MNDYITLALCKHDNDTRYFLFKAPFGAVLNSGDRVLVDTKNGNAFATVLCTTTVRYDSDELLMILTLAGTTYPKLKNVLAKVNFNYFEYGDKKNVD